MKDFFLNHSGEVLLIYGLAFFVLGVVIYVLPAQDSRFRFVPCLPLLAAFGLLHGMLEFVIYWKAVHLSSTALDWASAILLFVSFLPLFEFGLRVFRRAPVAGNELGKLFVPWLYMALLLAILTVTHVADDALTGFLAGTRYLLGFPAALLAGFGLLIQGREMQAPTLNKPMRNYLHITAVSFVAYALFTVVLPKNDPALPALFLTQDEFLDLLGVPVQVMRALCAFSASLAITHLVRQINRESRLRETEQARQTELANDLLRQEIEQHRKTEQELAILAVAFETQEAVIITDQHANIQRVNGAFQKITGYTAAEVIGRNPRILSSGQQDERFYQEMWLELQKQGKWCGEIWNRRKNGEIYPEWLTITSVTARDNQISHYVGTFTDISLRKQAEEEIRRLALFDPLTKLPNRRLLQDRLTLAFNASGRNRHFGAVMFIDLDNFKNINDTKGHEAGDQLLIDVAGRLLSRVRESDTVARVGGDEFVLVLTDLDVNVSVAAGHAERIAGKILGDLRQPFRLGDYEYHGSASIGISMFFDHETTMEDLFKHADTAMYRAKSSGKNAFFFFDQSMQAALEARFAMETELRSALDKQQLCLYFQAQTDSNRHIIGAEVLLRWNHPQRGLVGPGEFIPLAEESGLILPIGQWVLEQACAQLKAWETDPHGSHLQLAVNVSALQFRQADFIEQVEAALKQSRANPARLKLELTESMIMQDVEDCIQKMRELKLLGISFSLDDFGTGYSSLSYLKRLPIDQLKIDQSFVRDIASDPNDEAIVRTIIAMAESLKLDAIAEGVETEGQLAFLKRSGCASFQGYLLGRPLPIANFEHALHS